VKVADAMTREVVAVPPDASLKEAARLLVERRVSGLPVVDAGGRVVGVVSETDVVACEAGGSRVTVRDAMSAPAITIGPERPLVSAAELMVGESVDRLPVTEADGRLVGIVTRADLVRAFARSDEEIAREIREEVLARRLWLDPGSVRVEVADGEVTLSGRVDGHADVEVVAGFVRRVPGVVSVRSRLLRVGDG